MSLDPALSKEARAALSLMAAQAEKTLRPHRPRPQNAREIALRGILRVLYEASYSQLTLNGLLEDIEDSGVRAHATRLFYGCLEYLWQLDAELRRFSKQKLERYDPEVLGVLRLGLYELRHMETEPAFVVHSAVELVKRWGFKSAQGLVNGILRRAAGEHAHLPQQLWLDVSVHPQLALDLSREIETDRLKEYFLATLEPQALSVRVRDQALNKAEYEPSPYLDDFAVYDPRISGPLPVNPDFVAGRITAQGVAAGMAVHYLDPQSGELVFDACAAPGNKTLQMLDRGAKVIAQDVHPQRMRLIRDLWLRAGQPSKLQLRLNDADALSELPALMVGRCDRVLVDAPCSGLGMLQGKPELRIFYEPDKIQELAQLQIRILTQAFQALKLGGKLLYSTCTLMRAENSEVVQAFLSQHPNAEQIPLGFGRDEVEALVLAPELPGEGFYYAALKRRSF